MIDVLSFPPNEGELDALRRSRVARCVELERRARVALFISVALFVTWVADVAAVFEHPAGHLPAAFGIASLGLAITIVASHWIGRVLLARSRRLLLSTTQGFAAVRLNEARDLLELAGRDAVVAQYLRIVGRQQRPLRSIEMAALFDWAREQSIDGPQR